MSLASRPGNSHLLQDKGPLIHQINTLWGRHRPPSLSAASPPRLKPDLQHRPAGARRCSQNVCSALGDTPIYRAAPANVSSPRCFAVPCPVPVPLLQLRATCRGRRCSSTEWQRPVSTDKPGPEASFKRIPPTAWKPIPVRIAPLSLALRLSLPGSRCSALPQCRRRVPGRGRRGGAGAGDGRLLCPSEVTEGFCLHQARGELRDGP